MRELFTMWRNTRMVMLVAVVAAIYAAVLIPFKVFSILPGLTSVRPANVLPVIFGLMFGPAAAWGSAIGNLIADIFGGTFGPGSAGGFLGNFFFGLLAYKLWGNLLPLSSGEEPDFRNSAGRQLAEYAVIALAASAACAVIISWVADALGLVPFAVLAPLIMTNNSIAAVVLGPPLLYLTYPRIKQMRLLYADVLRDDDLPERDNTVGAWLLAAVPVVWLALGVVLTTGFSPLGIQPTFSSAPGASVQVGLGVAAFVVVVGASYLAGERISDLVLTS